MNTGKRFDDILKIELKKRLKREPTNSEIINGDTDADLVSEIMWQLIEDLDKRLDTVEKTLKM